MTYHWNFDFLWQYRSLLGIGILYTVGFSIATSLAGFLIGCAIALLRLSDNKIMTVPVIGFTEIFRCTPVLVQLIWCYYALPVLIGLSLSPAAAAFLTLSLYGGAFYAEIIRGGIVSIEAGQWDAGRAIGLRRGALMRRIILPQAFRRMTPPLVNQSILQLKNTSLVSVLAVHDLLYQGQLITSATYRPLETYTAVAILYFAILFPLTQLVQALERKMASRST